MALPFFIYPVLVWFIRKLLIFLFSKRTERNSEKLEDLKVAKKKILEEVMETETYKNAKLILERFDPEAKKKAVRAFHLMFILSVYFCIVFLFCFTLLRFVLLQELESTPVRSPMTPRPGQEIRQRGVVMRPMPMGTPHGMVMTPPPGARPLLGPAGTPVAPGGPPDRSALSASVLQGAVPRTPPSPMLGMHPPGPPLARPILPKDRGALDRVIEYLVGDGPQNRYALICQQCFSHNGMALKEEFEYLAFRCAYCYFMNPARKTRPQAPRLPEFNFEKRLRAESRSPGPSPRSGTDTEESAPPSGDEKEMGDCEEITKEVDSERPLEEQDQLQQKEEEKEEEEIVQEEVAEDEPEQSRSSPCETGAQPS
uniref:Endoplasmic reticulum junction formation protein lunapark n=1 Tax=Neolamprologus brichardi TaxID=32507 RepID=A0A3Q4H6C7_NEOBR